jgi:hypothetical protein
MRIKNDEAKDIIKRAFRPLECDIEQKWSGDPIGFEVRTIDSKVVVFRESVGVPHATYSDANLLKVYLENIRERIEKDGHKLDALTV